MSLKQYNILGAKQLPITHLQSTLIHQSLKKINKQPERRLSDKEQLINSGALLQPKVLCTIRGKMRPKVSEQRVSINSRYVYQWQSVQHTNHPCQQIIEQ
jgi:hypothetical protein